MTRRSTRMGETRRCAVLVVGAGPAGLTAALVLARGGCRVILAGLPPKPRSGETLPPEARSVLQHLDAWEDFMRSGHRAIGGYRSAWGSTEVNEQDFFWNPHGCGWQLDRQRFEASIARAAVEAGAELLIPAWVRSVSRENVGRWIVEVDFQVKNLTVRAETMFLAGGSFSTPFFQLRRERQDHLVALEAVIQRPRVVPHEGYPLVEATEVGWWYSSMLDSTRNLAVLFTDPELVPRHTAERGRWWCKHFYGTHHIAQNSDVPVPVTLRCRSVSIHRLSTAGGDNWVAIGDAAFALDPLSGQGLLKALESALMAANLLLESAHWKHRENNLYHKWCDHSYVQHLFERARWYAAERRWSGSTFWVLRKSRS